MTLQSEIDAIQAASTAARPQSPSSAVTAELDKIDAAATQIETLTAATYSGTVSVPAGFTVAAGAVVTFDPNVTTTVTVAANVVVNGILRMRPANPGVVHSLIFSGINESNFVGGGMDPLTTDVGLWVMGSGLLDIVGSPKLAWGRITASLAAAATSLTLDVVPTGWQVGDEIAICPSELPTVANHSLRFDVRTISAISGSTVSWTTGLTFPHPVASVETPAGTKTLAPEVLNLTRNVRIEGTSVNARAHIFLRSYVPQSLSNLAGRYLGPRQMSSSGYTVKVLGRYPLHWHLAYDSSRGSTVTGMVQRDCGSHAYATHESHGVTYTNCLSYDTTETAYWWDPRPFIGAPAPPTNDVVYDRCVAALVRSVPDFRGSDLAGFSLLEGTGNTITACVATGVQGSSRAPGILWPEGAFAVWTSADCVVHNNKQNGVYTWQNTSNAHVVSRFVCWHNGTNGIEHGAYSNRYRYEECVFYANRQSALRLHSVSVTAGPQVFLRNVFDAGSQSAYGVYSDKHTLQPPAGIPTVFEGNTFRGHTTAGFGCPVGGGAVPESYQLVDNIWTGNKLWLSSTINAASLIVLDDIDELPVDVRRVDQPGTVNTGWNASVS